MSIDIDRTFQRIAEGFADMSPEAPDLSTISRFEALQATPPRRRWTGPDAFAAAFVAALLIGSAIVAISFFGESESPTGIGAEETQSDDSPVTARRINGLWVFEHDATPADPAPLSGTAVATGECLTVDGTVPVWSVDSIDVAEDLTAELLSGEGGVVVMLAGGGLGLDGSLGSDIVPDGIRLRCPGTTAVWYQDPPGRSEPDTTVVFDPSEVLLGAWRLETLEIGGQALDLPETPGWLQFDDHRYFQGQSSCNTFGGEYAFDGTSFTTSNVAWTAKGCEVIGDLEATRRISRVEEATLDLLSDGFVAVVMADDNDTARFTSEDISITYRRSPSLISLPRIPPQPVSFTDTSNEEIAAVVPMWTVGTGLREDDTDTWRDRLERTCSGAVWDAGSLYGWAEEFVADDPAFVALASEDPLLDNAATAIWAMTVALCPERFPDGEIDRGPPGNESGPGLG